MSMAPKTVMSSQSFIKRHKHKSTFNATVNNNGNIVSVLNFDHYDPFSSEFSTHNINNVKKDGLPPVRQIQKTGEKHNKNKSTRTDKI